MNAVKVVPLNKRMGSLEYLFKLLLRQIIYFFNNKDGVMPKSGSKYQKVVRDYNMQRAATQGMYNPNLTKHDSRDNLVEQVLRQFLFYSEEFEAVVYLMFPFALFSLCSRIRGRLWPSKKEKKKKKRVEIQP